MSYDQLMLLLKSRRSCRSFSADPIDDAVIEAIMEAGRWTPSSHNSQSSYIVRISSEKLKKQLRANTMQITGIEFDPFYGAREIVAVLNSNKDEMAFLDGSMTVYNMLLAAEALGIGACWINTAQYEMFGKNSVLEEAVKSLSLPESCKGIGYVALGYPSSSAIAEKHILPRKSGRVFAV